MTGDEPIADGGIISFTGPGEKARRLGVVQDGGVLPMPGSATDVHAERRAMEALLARLCDAASAYDLPMAAEPAIPLEKVAVHAPFVPNTIFCSGPNYVSHLKEMKRRPRDDISRDEASPYFFMKSGLHTVVGTNSVVAPPLETAQLDWEVELAVVIGRGGRAIDAAHALDHVAGYSIVIDLSARDRFNREDMPSWKDWLSAKSFEGAAPFGPAILPARALRDPQNLELSLSVNAERKQHGNTAEMVFRIAEQIAYVSQRVALRPGDVISTGSPAGVGFGSGTFLKSGDRVVARIEGIGSLSIAIGAPPEPSDRT